MNVFPTEPRPVAAKFWTAGLPVILAFLAAVLLRTINVPWVENDNWYGAVYSQAAHNNLRAGFVTTGGVPATLYFGPLPIPRDAFYVHHPTLFPIMVTAVFAVFGEAEWVARLVPIICSLLSVVFLWLLMRSILGARAATLSAAIFATLPMELHYGDLVDFEPCLVMWMFATLCCLRSWQVTRRARWAALAAACCEFALWTDWPGYLFVISVAVGLFLEKRRPSRVFALVLIAMAGVSGALFLLQIRHVNPDAWADLRLAVTMRLGSGIHTGSGPDAAIGAHFTFVEWCKTIVNNLNRCFLPISLVLAVGGTIRVLRSRTSDLGLRTAGWAAFHMAVAGVLYVVIFRNESFIHDFAAFYLIGCIAIMAGLALDRLLAAAAEKNLGARLVVPSTVVAGLLALAVFGCDRAEGMRSQFYMLDGVTQEPRPLIPALGSRLRETFSEDTTILANVDPYGSSLTYYAQRMILNNLTDAADWKSVIASERGPLGGVIWLDGPDAAAILAELPPSEITPVEVEGIAFAFWRPAAHNRIR